MNLVNRSIFPSLRLLMRLRWERWLVYVLLKAKILARERIELRHWYYITESKMAESILILGNGFDLDLGLHTRYSEFWGSERWKEVMENCPEPYFISSLEKYRITHNWFDLESGLLEGAKRLKDKLRARFDASNYYESFQILIRELSTYIEQQQEIFTPTKNSVAERLLKAIDSKPLFKCIYTFNYTSIAKMSQRFNVSQLPYIYYVHGSLYPNEQIILGIETEDFSSIPPQLTFLIKSNGPYYHYTNLLRDLELADHVVFFGHSINGMDFPYFKDFFLQLVNLPISKMEKRNVTIITYDERSAMQIKDSFRANGIDVRSLYNKITLEFILTKGIYEKNPNETFKFAMLLKDLE